MDHLNGAGSGHVGGFAGSVQSEIKIAFHCKNSDHLSVPVEYNFANIGGVDLVAKYVDGHIEAEGSIGPLGLLVHTKSGNDCNTDVMKHVILRKGASWTWGFCNRGLEWYRCKWESPEVSYMYHFKLAIRLAGGTVTLTNPRVRISDKRLNVCNQGGILSAVVIVGGEVLQIDTSVNFPAATNVVNALIDVGVESVETMVANTIGNEATWLVNTTGSIVGNLFCIF